MHENLMVRHRCIRPLKAGTGPLRGCSSTRVLTSRPKITSAEQHCALPLAAATTSLLSSYSLDAALKSV